MNKSHLTSKIVLLLSTLGLSTAAFAGFTDPQQVPEPSMLGLFIAAGVVAILLKKRK